MNASTSGQRGFLRSGWPRSTGWASNAGLPAPPPGQGCSHQRRHGARTPARIKDESASQCGERHWTSMSGFDAWDDILTTFGRCDLPDLTCGDYRVGGEIAVDFQPNHRSVLVLSTKPSAPIPVLRLKQPPRSCGGPKVEKAHPSSREHQRRNAILGTHVLLDRADAAVVQDGSEAANGSCMPKPMYARPTRLPPNRKGASKRCHPSKLSCPFQFRQGYEGDKATLRNPSSADAATMISHTPVATVETLTLGRLENRHRENLHGLAESSRTDSTGNSERTSKLSISVEFKRRSPIKHSM